MEKCDILLDDAGDFFSGLFESRPSKVIALLFSGLGGMVLLYSIIWYERFGSDNKRTLLNKLVSSLCWTCFEWFFSIQIVDMLRYMSDPLPHYLCVLELHFKNVIYIQQMLFMTGMIITRYIFIFCLRNPAAFQDDFWNLLLNIWIIGYSIIAQGISYLMFGRYTIYYLHWQKSIARWKYSNKKWIAFTNLVIDCVAITHFSEFKDLFLQTENRAQT
jgi:hypothetical protein